MSGRSRSGLVRSSISERATSTSAFGMWRRSARVGQRMQRITGMADHQRRLLNAAAAALRRHDRPDQHAMQHGADHFGVGAAGDDRAVEQRIRRLRQPAHEARQQTPRRPSVMRGQHQWHEKQRSGRHAALCHRHFQQQGAYTLRRCAGHGQCRDRTERKPAEDRSLDAKMIHQTEQLLGVEVNAVFRRLDRLVAAAVAEQIEQDHAIAFG